MHDFPQTNGCDQAPTVRKPLLSAVRGKPWIWAGFIAWGLLVQPVLAQTLRLGPVDLFLQGTLEFGYSSNVDGAYPEDEDPVLATADFYWKPGLKLNSQQVPFFRNSTLSLSAGIAYQDYLERNDLDTELYNIRLAFNTILQRFTLGGSAGSEYSIDAAEDQYIPGGVTYDPTLTHSADAFIKFHWRRLRLEARSQWTSERHDKEEYKIGDNDETVFFAGAYLDIFTWGSLFYSVEQTLTTFTETGVETDITTKDAGFQGAIPLTWLAHPQITYSLGIQSKDDSSDDEKDGTWEPEHSIRAEDSLQMGKTLTLSGYVEWNNKVYDDDIGFTYALRLDHLLGSRAKQSLSFTQEPRSTLGSTTDTETTTYAYDFSMTDFLIKNLQLGFGASYEESTPLDTDSVTEETTRFNVALAHNRRISRQLSRVLAYKYTWETSNFHHDGPKEEHRLTYGFTYDF